MTACPDCYPTPGLREIALGWRDSAGDEHRKVWVACCTCDAGLALVEATGAKAVEGGNCPRVTWRFVLDTWRAALVRLRRTEVGWWVTSRDLRRLPVEATLTPGDRARMDEARAASQARKASRANATGAGRRSEGFARVSEGLRAPASILEPIVPDAREAWAGAADGDPGPWEAYG
jgi:hypothetical protein